MQKPSTGAIESILHVDDDRFSRTLLQFFLEETDIRLTSVEDEPSCLAALESALPTVVLMDAQLKQTTGLLLSQKIYQRYPGVPIIFLSGDTEDKVFSGEKPANVKGLIPKSFTPDDLLDTLLNILYGSGDQHTLKNSNHRKQLNRLRRVYIAHLLGRREVLFEFLTQVKNSGAVDCHALKVETHKIAGTAGLHELLGVAGSARAVEETIEVFTTSQASPMGKAGANNSNFNVAIELHLNALIKAIDELAE